PRAYQWVDGSAYLHHMELVRKARGTTLPEDHRKDPVLYQGGSDSFLGPVDPIRLADDSWGLDFEAELAVITGDVPQGTRAEGA
ncbi:fumarylacetoacetate hydrolase family protein, partial [Shewanella sp. C32]